MSASIPVSAIILTLNEESNIADCIASVLGLCDEVFVVDSFSSDNTVGIARALGANVCQHPFVDYAQQRDWAQNNLETKNLWVLHLDADERISRELADELRGIFSQTIEADGFMASRRTLFKGKWIRFGDHYPVYHLRIFKKDKGAVEKRLYDQNFAVNGKTGILKGDIINIINPDLGSWKERHSRWAQLEAREALSSRKTANVSFKGTPIQKRGWRRYNIYYRLPIFLRVLAYFIYRFIIRLGFLDGMRGWEFHFWHGFWFRMLIDYRILRLMMKGKDADTGP